jgi:flagellar hook-length control protein FliK
LPAAATIAPSLVAIPAAMPGAPSAPQGGDAFGQVLQAVRDAASGPTAAVAANNDVQRAISVADSPAPVRGATAGQVATTAAPLTGGSADARGTTRTDRSSRAGRDDSDAAAPRSVGTDTATPVVSTAPAQAAVTASLDFGRVANPATIAMQAVAAPVQAKPVSTISPQTAASGQTPAPWQTAAPDQTAGPGRAAEPDQPAVPGQLTKSNQTAASSPTTEYRPDATHNPNPASDPTAVSASDQLPIGASDQTATAIRAAAPNQTTGSNQTAASNPTAAYSLATGSVQTAVSSPTDELSRGTSPEQTAAYAENAASSQAGTQAAGLAIEANPIRVTEQAHAPASVPAPASMPAPASGEVITPAAGPDTGRTDQTASHGAASTPAGVEPTDPLTNAITPHADAPAEAVSGSTAAPDAPHRTIQNLPIPADPHTRAGTTRAGTTEAGTTGATTEPIGAQPAGTAAAEPVQVALPATVASTAPANTERLNAGEPNRNEPLLDTRQAAAPGAQTASGSVGAGTLSQTASASIAVAAGQSAITAPRPSAAAPPAHIVTPPAAGAAPIVVPPPAMARAPDPATPAAAPPDAPPDIPAAAASDHKAPPHPIEADAGPAQPAATPDASLELAVPGIVSAATPTTTSAASAASPTAAHHASPAEQLAPVLLALARTPGGGQQLTVRLQPGELGMVQVRIARALSGTTQIDVTAENPTTLLALQRDQPQLHRTLDEAGIPAAGRTVTFHVVPAAQSAANSNGPGASASHGDSQAGAASRSNTGRTDADGSSGGRDGYLTRERNNYSTTRRPGTAPAPAGTAERVNRIGLDITA